MSEERDDFDELVLWGIAKTMVVVATVCGLVFGMAMGIGLGYLIWGVACR